MLILTVAEYLHELFEDRGLAPVATLCKSCRVVVVAINLPLMLVVIVFRTESCRADGACKVVDVKLSIQGRDIRPSKRPPTSKTKEVQSSKIVGLAERILSFASFIVNWEEFGCYDLSAILSEESVESRQYS